MAAILVGEEPYSCDPAVSEWGNPPDFIGKLVVKVLRTRGSKFKDRSSKCIRIFIK